MGDFDFLDGASEPARQAVTSRPHSQGSARLPAALVAMGGIFSVVIIGGMGVMLSGVGVNAPRVGEMMDSIYDEVVEDAVRQYNTVLNAGGSQLECSVRAGFVMAACAQAKDESGYAKWKKIHDAHCRRAGIPIAR